MKTTIAKIREVHKLRQDLHKAEKSLTLQVRAACRRFTFDPEDRAGSLKESHVLYNAVCGKDDHRLAAQANFHCEALLAARALVQGRRKLAEKEMEKLAKQLPVWEGWAQEIRGFGPLGLAQIVGEAGDLGNYGNPAKLWKRMGVGLVDGERQRLKKGTTEAEALRIGFNPRRRAVMFCIGEAIKKCAGSPYRDVYLERKKVEETNALERGQQVVPAAKIPKSGKEGYMSLGHVDRRAQRYAEKRLLRDLWSAWRKASI